MTDYTGECLCGAVRYRIEAAAPKATFLCHCSRCRQEGNQLALGTNLRWGRTCQLAQPIRKKASASLRQAAGSPSGRYSATHQTQAAKTSWKGSRAHRVHTGTGPVMGITSSMAM